MAHRRRTARPGPGLLRMREAPGAGILCPMGEPVVLERARLDDLFAALRRRGYTLIGPTVMPGAKEELVWTNAGHVKL